MITRRDFTVATALAASSFALGNSNPVEAAQDQPKMADFLFVQSAKKLTFEKVTNKLTLVDVAPMTIFFTDRPERLAGNMKTSAFIPFWSDGKDSFKSDPPNADVSILDGNSLKQVVVELQEPQLSADKLTYTVKVLGGVMPESGSDVSVFIDIIGRPLTPFSYAGVARRTYRRAFYY